MRGVGNRMEQQERNNQLVARLRIWLNLLWKYLTVWIKLTMEVSAPSWKLGLSPSTQCWELHLVIESLRKVGEDSKKFEIRVVRHILQDSRVFLNPWLGHGGWHAGHSHTLVPSHSVVAEGLDKDPLDDEDTQSIIWAIQLVPVQAPGGVHHGGSTTQPRLTAPLGFWRNQLPCSESSKRQKKKKRKEWGEREI